MQSWWKGSGARRNCSFIEINFSHSLLFYLCQQHYLGGARKTRKLSSLKWKKCLQKKNQSPFLRRIPTFSFIKLFQLFLRKICDDVGLLIRRVGEVRWAEWNWTNHNSNTKVSRTKISVTRIASIIAKNTRPQSRDY